MPTKSPPAEPLGGKARSFANFSCVNELSFIEIFVSGPSGSIIFIDWSIFANFFMPVSSAMILMVLPSCETTALPSPFICKCPSRPLMLNTAPFASGLSASDTLDRIEYGADTSGRRGFISGLDPQLIPIQYCLSKGKSSAFFSPKIISKTPSEVVVSCVSDQSSC